MGSQETHDWKLLSHVSPAPLSLVSGTAMRWTWLEIRQYPKYDTPYFSPMADKLLPSLAFLESQYDISRRTLQRTRAKLSRLGLIEHITWMNSGYGGRQGWKLSSRFSTALRRLADTCNAWWKDKRLAHVDKDSALADLLKT